MVPHCIHHTNPHATANHDHLDQCASLSTANHDCQSCWQKAPLFARQTISIFNDARCPWLPATIIHAADHDCTLSKSSAADNINVLVTTFVSVTQMLSSLTHATVDVAPATSSHMPAAQAMQPAPHVAPATSQPAATTPTSAVPHTLQKTPAVHVPCSAQLANWHNTYCPLPLCSEQ